MVATTYSGAVTVRRRAHDLYRAWGAELPGGDLVGARGISMDGWFWRISDPVKRRVAIALVGLNTPRRGGTWAIAGLAGAPTGGQHMEVLPTITAARHGMRLDAHGEPGHFVAHRTGIDVQLGHARLVAHFDQLVDWQGALGASSIFQTVPGMNQYWHPWLLGGRATGSLITPDDRWDFHEAQLYAEKNWGRGGFPEHWWWGQAQGFDEPDACAAFGGGQIHLGRPGRRALLRKDVTALVVKLPDGEQVRLGNPGVSPVDAQVGDGHWLLHGRSRRWQVRVEAAAPISSAFVLPVPLVEERRLAPGALESQLGQMQVAVHRDGRLHWQGSTTMAALETGGRRQAEAELARRGGRPEPEARA